MKTFGITVLGFVLGFFAYDWGKLDREHGENLIRDTIRATIHDEFRISRQEAEA